MRRFAFAGAVLAILAAGVTQIFAAGPNVVAATKATDYIRTVQNPDGGFPDFGSNSSPGATIEAEFAFASTGINPANVQTGGKSPADYLATQAASFSSTPGGAAKLVVGIATMHLDATNFGGIDSLAVMESNYNTGTGQYGSDLFAQALYMLAERAFARPIPPAAVTYLESLQSVDGGWEDCCGFGEDTNTTALAIRALIAASVSAADSHIVNGLAYLKASQQADGGFPYTAPGASDPNSTAYGIQAIVAAGQSLDAGGPWDAGSGNTPFTALATFQNPLNGAMQYFGSDSLFATYQGAPGFMVDAFPERHVCSDDAECDTVPDASDNCLALPNVDQANADRNLVDLPPVKPFDDNTLANSDDLGDACDPDDDNDGFLDVSEAEIGPAGTDHAQCPSATGPTDPRIADTDGDGTLDQSECQLGTDPVNAASKPAAIVGPDADGDGLPDTIESLLGSDPNNRDSDGDGVRDGIEFRGYNTNVQSNDTDGDGCDDGREIASVDALSQVNSIDLQQVALAFSANQAAVNYILDMDVDKSGSVNSIDLQFVAKQVGNCLLSPD